LTKVPLPDQLLSKCFTKSLIGTIARDVTMGGVFTEEHVISHAQYLDLIYFQTRMIYDLIPDAPCPSTNPTLTPPTYSHSTDGVIDVFHAETRSADIGHTNLKSNNSDAQNTPTPTPFIDKTTKVNSVQSAPTRKNQNKKKGKGKKNEDKNNS
jgi:hypothetical protein